MVGKWRAALLVTGQGDLVEHGELLDRLQSHHVGIIVCRLQMGHGFERVNCRHILHPQHLLLQKRGHEQRPL